MRRRSGQAAPPGGPLAVRDGAELLLPGGQCSGSAPDDGDAQEHAGHAPQLPRRHRHVLQATGVRLPPPGRLAPSTPPNMDRLAPHPPTPLAVPSLPHRSPSRSPSRSPPPAPPPGGPVAPRRHAGRPPAAGRHVGAPQPEMRTGSVLIGSVC